MTHSKVFGYVRTNLKKGYSKADIKKALGKSGYDKSDINKAFEDVENHNHAAPKLLKITAITIVILAIALLVPWNRLFTAEVAEPETLQGLYIVDLQECEETYDIESAAFLDCAYTYDVSIKIEEDCKANIEEEMALQVCISVINADMGSCVSDQKPNQIDFCNMLYAFVLNDVEACDHVRIEELKQVCIDKMEKEDYSMMVYPYNFLWS